MKTKLLAIVLVGGLSVLISCDKGKEIDPAASSAPKDAKSDKIWMVGEGETLQYWSDAIRIPGCNKSDFKGGGTPQEPISDCRNNFDNPDLGYFYTAEYVVQNAGRLCPDGWRVPSHEDFVQLDKNLGGSGKNVQEDDGTVRYNAPEWGGVLGGVAMAEISENLDYGARAYYRGLPEKYESELILMYDQRGVYIAPNNYYFGAQVRCVK